MKLYEGKNNEIRRAMRKFSLRVNRLVRTNYGPYSLGEVPDCNSFREVPVSTEIKKILFHYYKQRASLAEKTIQDTKAEVIEKHGKLDEPKTVQMAQKDQKKAPKNQFGFE